MDYRSNNSPYRSLPLMQRDEIARRSAASARRANDAAERDESRRRNRDYDLDEEMERTLPRRRPSASYHGSIWERSASEIEETLRPPREHVSAYLDESSVVRVTRRSDRSRSWQSVDTRDDYEDRSRPRPTTSTRDDRGRVRQTIYIDDAYEDRDDWRAPRSQRFSLVEDDDRPTARTSSRDQRARLRHEDEWAFTRQDQFARIDGYDDVDEYDGYDEFEEYDGYDDVDQYDEYDGYDDYAYDDRPSIGSRIMQGLQAVVGGVLAIPRMIGSGIVGFVRGMSLRVVMVLGVIAVAGVMLYAPIRDLYLASRQLDTLRATYDALAAENAQIREELEVLQTKDGIENEARARGYVEPGETKVVVEGLPETEDATVAYTIEDVELPDDRAWYIRILDDLFGYNPEA